MIILKAHNRKDNTAKEGQIKAVAYGPKFTATSITVDYAEFIKVYNQTGETGVIGLDIDGKTTNVLVQEIKLEPVKNTVMHIDFYVPEAGKKVNANIPLDFIGESDAVKQGNILIKVMHEVEVEALPENLPHDIKVDISKLVDLNSDITVADLVFPKNVTCLAEMTDVVASIVAPKEDEVETVVVDLSAIEVEKKGKKEEGDDKDK